MESNDKKPKRPRISSGASSLSGESNRENEGGRYEKINYNNSDRYQNSPRGSYDNRQQYPARPYQPRYTSASNDGGYQHRQGGYTPRDNGTGEHNRGYQPHSGGYQPRSDYNRHNDGYQPRGTGGYQPRTNRYQNSFDGEQGNQYSGYNRPQHGGYRPQGGGRPQRPMQRKPAKGMRPGKTFVPRPRPVIYDMPIPDPNEQIRLNKFMANSGICSRREADEYIKQGLVKVNGKVVTELGTKISHNDNVEYDDKVVALENKTYILLNKPKDCVTTSDDPQGRTTVLDLVKGACTQRIYPVGRLDRNTTGVLLLTNDGDLASKLTHPQYVKKKIYHVWVDKDIAEEDMQRIADGVELEDGTVHADAISYATETDRNQAGIEIHSGQNRIVRRIFEKLGYHVTKLDRVYFAGLTKKNLPRGRWRYLTQQEVNLLKKGAFE